MKKILISIFCFLFLATSVFADVTLTDTQNRFFQLAASGWVSQTQTYINNLNINFRSQNSISVMRDWLKVMSAQSGSLALAFPDAVHDLFLSKFEGFQLRQTISIPNDHQAPQNCSVSGSDIECDDNTGKEERLFSWNAGTQLFTDTGASASCAAGTCTFSNPGSGTYVVGFTGAEFCTTYLTIP